MTFLAIVLGVLSVALIFSLVNKKEKKKPLPNNDYDSPSDYEPVITVTSNYYPTSRQKSRSKNTWFNKTNLPEFTDHFVAIDVETANNERSSICQLAFIEYKNKEAIQFKSYFIKPPGNTYNQQNTRIHSISAHITENKPTFAELWPEILSHINNKTLVAHNAAFDSDCIIKTLKHYDIEIPKLTFDCTFVRSGMKLKDACKIYHIELKNHHHALADANACAELYIKLSENTAPDNKALTDPTPVIKQQPNSNANPENPIFDKKIVFTGQYSNYTRSEIKELALSLGARVSAQVSKSTNFVVYGYEPGETKIKTANMHNENGCNIFLITEDEFIAMTKNYF